MNDLSPDQLADAPPTYVARANALEYEAIWRLRPDLLELQGGPTAGPEVLPA